MGTSDKHNNNSSPSIRLLQKRGAVYCLSLTITKWANYSTKNTCHTNKQLVPWNSERNILTSRTMHAVHCRVHSLLDFYGKTRKTFKRSSLKQKWKKSFPKRHGIYIWHQQNQWELFHYEYLFANFQSFALRGVSLDVMLLFVGGS